MWDRGNRPAGLLAGLPLYISNVDSGQTGQLRLPGFPEAGAEGDRADWPAGTLHWLPLYFSLIDAGHTGQRHLPGYPLLERCWYRGDQAGTLLGFLCSFRPGKIRRLRLRSCPRHLTDVAVQETGWRGHSRSSLSIWGILTPNSPGKYCGWVCRTSPHFERFWDRKDRPAGISGASPSILAMLTPNGRLRPRASPQLGRSWDRAHPPVGTLPVLSLYMSDFDATQTGRKTPAASSWLPRRWSDVETARSGQRG